jgi:hypothetical protein
VRGRVLDIDARLRYHTEKVEALKMYLESVIDDHIWREPDGYYIKGDG